MANGTYPGVHDLPMTENPVNSFGNAYMKGLESQLKKEEMRYYSKIKDAEIAEQVARTGLYGEEAKYYGLTSLVQAEEAAANAQLLRLEHDIYQRHPEFKGPQDVAYLEYLSKMAGMWDQNNYGQSMGGNPQMGQPQMQSQGGMQTPLPSLPGMNGGSAPNMGNQANMNASNPFKKILETKVATMGRTPEEQSALSLQSQNNEQYDFDRTNQLHTDANTSRSLEKNLKSLREAYNRIPQAEKGALAQFTNPLNPFARTNSDVQFADSVMAQIVADSAKLIQGTGHINDSNFKLAVETKPSIFKNAQAFESWLDILDAGSGRQKEAYDFNQLATKSFGLTGQEADFLFNQYMNQRPPTNETGGNWQYAESYYDYLTPEGIEAAKEGEPYIPEFLDPSGDNSELLRILPEEQADKLGSRIIKYNERLKSRGKS